MYKKLKKKLILMYWITSSLILTSILITILFFTVRENFKDDLINFEHSTVSYTEKMQQLSILDTNWLKQLECDNHWYLQAFENDTDLNLPNTYPYTGELEQLFQALTDIITREQPEFIHNIHQKGSHFSSIVQLTAYHKDYYGRMCEIKMGKIKRTLLIIQKFEPFPARCLRYLRLLLLCELSGSAMLFCLSFLYVTRVVHPIEVANEKQKEFIAAVSHELRSPLAIFTVGLDSMKEELTRIDDNNRLKRFLYPMEGECLRMNRLIEDMLLLAATDQKNWTIQMKEVDVETLLIECYDAFTMMNQASQNRIHIDLSEQSLPYIQGDEERLKQVIMILLDNAMSYTDFSEGIVLRAYERDSEIRIEVEDHGSGISDEEKQKIFDSFYRREGSRSNKQHFGLGLSIAKRLVELHHGRIEVKDTAGHGTTFVVCLAVEHM